MITEKEKKAALYALSFNRVKALKLFVFCMASFSVGLAALYWGLDYRYGTRLELAKTELLSDLDRIEHHYETDAISDMYSSVVGFYGLADFDNVKDVSIQPKTYRKQYDVVAVKGQKRQLAPGVYELRFVETKDKVQHYNYD